MIISAYLQAAQSFLKSLTHHFTKASYQGPAIELPEDIFSTNVFGHLSQADKKALRLSSKSYKQRVDGAVHQIAVNSKNCGRLREILSTFPNLHDLSFAGLNYAESRSTMRSLGALNTGLRGAITCISYKSMGIESYLLFHGALALHIDACPLPERLSLLGLPNLKKLSLHFLPAYSFSLDVSQLPALQELELCGPRYAIRPEEPLPQLDLRAPRKLQTLSLTGCHLAALFLPTADTLQQLFIDTCKLNTPLHLSDRRSLKMLRVEKTSLPELLLPTHGSLSSLKLIELHINRPSRIDLSGLSALADLVVNSIYQQGISFPFPTMLQTAQLNFLRLTTPLNLSGQHKLKALEVEAPSTSAITLPRSSALLQLRLMNLQSVTHAIDLTEHNQLRDLSIHKSATKNIVFPRSGKLENVSLGHLNALTAPLNLSSHVAAKVAANNCSAPVLHHAN